MVNDALFGTIQPLNKCFLSNYYREHLTYTEFTSWWNDANNKNKIHFEMKMIWYTIKWQCCQSKLRVIKALGSGAGWNFKWISHNILH
jgi:hypothetical protein